MSDATPLSAALRLRRRDGLSVTRVDDDVFIVVPETEEVVLLNSLGRALWELMAEPATVGDMIDTVAAAFPDQTRAAVAADVEAFLNHLLKHDLARQSP